MKTPYIIVALLACMCISLYIRIVLPYDHVFTENWIKFSGVDSYWQMAQVDRIAPDFPHYLLQIFKIPFFVWFLAGVTWCIGLGNPTSSTIDIVGVYYPVVLAALTVIPVYFIGKTMFNKAVGLIAALLIAILPGELLGRSILGFTDDHIAEVLFSTTALMFFVMVIKARGKRLVLFSLLTALLMAIYLSTFRGGFIFLGIIAVYLYYLFIKYVVTHIKTWHLVIGLSLLPQVIIISLLAPFLMAKYGFIISGTTAITTLEMQPLLYPGGTFTLAVAWASFGPILLLIPIVIPAVVYKAIKTGESRYIITALWSLATLLLMLRYRRFTYYFAVNAALLTGYFLSAFWEVLRFKTRTYLIPNVIVPIVLLLIVLPNTQHAVAMAKYPAYTPSDAWYESLDWIKRILREIV
jgi:asparagine N-glycosylation enzyme membrane subunit Stt3